jgi:phage gp16-like protein
MAKLKATFNPLINRRNAELAKIHIAKKQLGMDDDTYRIMLANVAGVSSAGDLGQDGRQAVLDHLKKIGFKQTIKGRPHNMEVKGSRAAQLKKIEALLTIGKKSWSYADALAKRICKTDKIAWVEADQLYKIITALQKHAQRAGWELKEQEKT